MLLQGFKGKKKKRNSFISPLLSLRHCSYCIPAGFFCTISLVTEESRHLLVEYANMLGGVCSCLSYPACQLRRGQKAPRMPGPPTSNLKEDQERHGYGPVRACASLCTNGSFFLPQVVRSIFYFLSAIASQWAVSDIAMVTSKFPSACVGGVVLEWELFQWRQRFRRKQHTVHDQSLYQTVIFVWLQWYSLVADSYTRIYKPFNFCHIRTTEFNTLCWDLVW